MKFVDRVIKNSENGYKGYKFEIIQTEKASEDAQEAQDEQTAEESNKAVNDESKTVYLKIVIEHLDWVSIKTEESEEMFNDYKKSLGLFILLTNTQSELSMVKTLDLAKIMEKDEKTIETGRFETIIPIKISTAGRHNFKVVFADNFGTSINKDLIVNAQ